MTDVHRCMIVPASQQQFAAWLAASFAPISGAGMFKIGLKPEDSDEVTHYISVGPIDSKFSELLSDANTLYQACVSLEIRVALSQCEDLLSESDISDNTAQDALNRLNLKLVK